MSDDARTVLADFFRPNDGVYLLRYRDGVPTIVADSVAIPSGQISTALSGDGSTLVGYSLSPNNAVYQANYWTAATGYQYVPLPPNYVQGGYSSEARAVNADGSLILVNGGGSGAGGGSVYTWSPMSGFRLIASPGAVPGTSFTADFYLGSAMSSDGTVIAGRFSDCPSGCSNPIGSTQGAFVWTQSSGITALPFLSNSSYASGLYTRFSEVNGISNDGLTIVGTSVAANGILQAVYWRDGLINGLGYIPGTNPLEFQTIAMDASANGTVIVGGTSDSGGSFPDSQNGLAWRWTAATGMQNLNSLATSLGLSLNGWTMTESIDVSANGNVILGSAYNVGLDRLRPFLLSITTTGIVTTTQSRLVVEIRLPDITQQAIINQSFVTGVRGTLNGTQVSSLSFSGALGDPAGLNAILSTRDAIQRAAGLRRVTISAPLLTGVTTVNSNPRSATIDELLSVQTSLATVITAGPGTVATGDRGVCATPAVTNVNPTGCSLPGTTLTLAAGDTNTNDYTNTINTRQRTTTVSIDQVQTSNYEVRGTAGNQFGTVHALVGPAAFERGDRLIGQLLGLGDGDGATSSGVARAAMPVSNESGLGGGESGLTMFGGYFGGHNSINADVSIPVARVKGDSDGFVLGLQQALGEAAHIGIAVDHGSSEYIVRDPLYAETLKLKHTQAALFAGWNDGGFSLSGAASYGFGTARTNMLTPTTPALGKRDINSWSLGAQAGYALPLGKDASLTPHIGIRHTSAKLKGFAETGGPTPLLGLSQTVDRTRLYAGLEAKAGIDLGNLTLTPRVYGRIARDRGDASGTADLVFASAPAGPVMQALGPGIGKTVAEVGGVLDANVSDTVTIWASYDGSFRANAKSHFGKVGVSVKW
ncbi:autotransporter domain-containing protein [Sphingorhabdus contaminans]|uniref:autotransporter domain-containing protein n=1 Tax=Sphingorhabdus contaminans TaxID=1343899 RepID=UPI003D292EDE